MMACNISKTPLVRHFVIRGLAAQAQPQQCTVHGKIKNSKASNQIPITTTTAAVPISRVTVAVRAGSRYESYDNMGSSHMIRVAAGLATENNSHLNITRTLQKHGASLSATADREIIYFTLEGTQQVVTNSLDILSEVVSRPAFKQWELNDNAHRMKYEIRQIAPTVRTIDLLHRAAYRTELGNSIFCPKHRIGKLSSETVANFYCNHFKANRAGVGAINMGNEDLLNFVNELSLESGDTAEKPSKFAGGEIRKDKGGQLAHIAVGVPGGVITNEKEALAFAVLQRAIGTAPYLKYASSRSPLQTTLEQAAKDKPFAATAFNACYKDSGIFGVLLSAPADIAGGLLNKALEVVFSGNITGDVVTRAKQQLKSCILLSTEIDSQYVEDLALQNAYFGTAKCRFDLSAAVDSVTEADVQAALKKVQSANKRALAAVGNLSSVPYLDDLKFK